MGGIRTLPAIPSAASTAPVDASWSIPIVAGGATTAAGGLALLLAGVSDPATLADAGRARVAGGGMVLSLGAGIGVAGVTAMAQGREDDDAMAMFVTGLTTSAIAAPFVIWGASTWDEDGGNHYASKGRMVTGLVFTAAGIVTTSGGVVLAAWSADGTGWGSGIAAVESVPSLILGTAGIGVGIPLLAAGADVIDEHDTVPEVSVDPASIHATWTMR